MWQYSIAVLRTIIRDQVYYSQCRAVQCRNKEKRERKVSCIWGLFLICSVLLIVQKLNKLGGAG